MNKEMFCLNTINAQICGRNFEETPPHKTTTNEPSLMTIDDALGQHRFKDIVHECYMLACDAAPGTQTTRKKRKCYATP
jgi:hypothetical protein